MAAPRERLAPDLRFLLEEKEVPETVQDALAQSGFVTINRFAILDDNRSAVRAALTRDFGLDPQQDVAHRLSQVTVLDAWETACRRAEEDRKQEAEARGSRLPKMLGKAVHLSMHRAAEAIIGEQSDRVMPSSSLVEMVMEMIEETHLEAVPLAKVTCLEDSEDMKTGAVVDGSGVIRVKRGRVDIKEPVDPEGLRQRLKTLGVAHMYARLKHPARVWLQSATIELSSDYCDYLLGEHVRGLEAKDLQGNLVSRPQ